MTTQTGATTVPPGAQALLQAGSSAPIVLELAKLGSSQQWLTTGHAYADVVAALRDNSTALQAGPLAEYIAYSVPLHVADGWTFLARALDAVKAGDGDSAIHMAYYAELRAAMSLLASEGVGIFDNRHVAIGPNSSTKDWRGARTHQATWHLMDAWGSDVNRSAKILDAIRVEKRTISEWFDEAQILHSVQHIVGGRWLKEWSLDIDTFRKDRDLRNRVSYRPTKIVDSPNLGMDFKLQTIDPIIRTWEPLAPSDDEGGAFVDWDLLALALSHARDGTAMRAWEWHRFIDRQLSSAPPDLQAYLRNFQGGRYEILDRARETTSPPTVDSVLARATLLLRIANAVCAQRLDQASVLKEDLRFWWDRLGQDNGFWTQGGEPAPFSDLWADVSNSINSISGAIKNHQSPVPMSTVHQIAGPVVPLTQCSRSLFWLLGLDRI